MLLSTASVGWHASCLG